MTSGCIVRSDALADAIAQVARGYADQNERDHAALRDAVRSGRIEAMTETGAA